MQCQEKVSHASQSSPSPPFPLSHEQTQAQAPTRKTTEEEEEEGVSVPLAVVETSVIIDSSSSSSSRKCQQNKKKQNKKKRKVVLFKCSSTSSLRSNRTTISSSSIITPSKQQSTSASASASKSAGPTLLRTSRSTSTLTSTPSWDINNIDSHINNSNNNNNNNNNKKRNKIDQELKRFHNESNSLLRFHPRKTLFLPQPKTKKLFESISKRLSTTPTLFGNKTRLQQKQELQEKEQQQQKEEPSTSIQSSKPSSLQKTTSSLSSSSLSIPPHTSASSSCTRGSIVTPIMKGILRNTKSTTATTNTNTTTNTSKKFGKRFHYHWKDLLLPTWQICIALIAVLDIFHCWSTIRTAWNIQNTNISSSSSPTDDFFAKILSNNNLNTSSIFGGGGGGGGGSVHERERSERERDRGGGERERIDNASISPPPPPPPPPFLNNDTCKEPSSNGSSSNSGSGSVCSSSSSSSILNDTFGVLTHEIQLPPTLPLPPAPPRFMSGGAGSRIVVLSSHIPSYLSNSHNVGFLFCILCIINGIIRARRAQKLAYENAALDVFEKKLAGLCNTARSSLLCSTPSMSNVLKGYQQQQQGEGQGQQHQQNRHQQQQQQLSDELDQELARKTLRIWGPVLAQLTLWFVLIPWASFCCWTTFCAYANLDTFSCPAATSSNTSASTTAKNYNNALADIHSANISDMALLTIWLTRATYTARTTFHVLQTQAWTIFWKNIRHFALRQPIKLYLKIRQVLRWIRFVRYAGPLLRMVDKAIHHGRQLFRTWRQDRAAKRMKLHRIQRRGSLVRDIELIASNERKNRKLRSMKSQVFKRYVPEHYQTLLQKSVGETLEQEKKQRAKIKKKVETLTEDANKSWANLSDVYDQLVDLTQEVTSSVQKEVLSSHLIPPNTKFSVAWRTIVSLSLLLELLRLWASWKAYGDYTAPLADLLKHWFVTCDPDGTSGGAGGGSTLFLLNHHTSPRNPHNHKMKSMLFASGKFLTFGKVKFFNDQQRHLMEECLDASYTASLAQQIGKLVGNAIDIVCFLDIFVWFNTGELDPQGNVIPKPFFSRCILPGTVVQVFDHPTLPKVLPTLLLRIFGIIEAVGFARVLRWGLVLEPVITMLILAPLKAYWLSPAANNINDDDYTVYNGTVGGGGSTSSLSILATNFSFVNMSNFNINNNNSSNGSLMKMIIYGGGKTNDIDDDDDSYNYDYNYNNNNNNYENNHNIYNNNYENNHDDYNNPNHNSNNDLANHDSSSSSNTMNIENNNNMSRRDLLAATRGSMVFNRSFVY